MFLVMEISYVFCELETDILITGWINFIIQRFKTGFCFKPWFYHMSYLDCTTDVDEVGWLVILQYSPIWS
jgi:hypothetical protein